MPATISTLIAAADVGDPSAPGALFPALYSELHRLAQRQLRRNARGMTLGATSLLHEAYLDICQREAAFPDRARFMAYAARVMRGLIIDYVRRHQAQKRGGGFEITTLLPDAAAAPSADERQLARMSDALDELAALEPELAQVVDLKFFCGFSFVEIAAMRGVSERTVQRQWDKARIYLHRSLRAESA
jgi:RNA polymerase sigma factor (TIGR02999 family)